MPQGRTGLSATLGDKKSLRHPLPSPCPVDGRTKIHVTGSHFPSGSCESTPSHPPPSSPRRGYSHCWGAGDAPRIFLTRAVGESLALVSLAYVPGRRGTVNPASLGNAGISDPAFSLRDSSLHASLELIFQPRDGELWSWRDLGSASEGIAARPGTAGGSTLPSVRQSCHLPWPGSLEQQVWLVCL